MMQLDSFLIPARQSLRLRQPLRVARRRLVVVVWVVQVDVVQVQVGEVDVVQVQVGEVDVVQVGEVEVVRVQVQVAVGPWGVGVLRVS